MSGRSARNGPAATVFRPADSLIRPLLERRRPPVSALDEVIGSRRTPAGRGEAWLAAPAARPGQLHSVAPSRGSPCPPRHPPTARSIQRKAARHRRHHATGLDGRRRGRPHRVPWSTVPSWPHCGRRCGAGYRVQGVQEHARAPAVAGRRPRRLASMFERPGRDRLRGAATPRARPRRYATSARQPGARREGRPARGAGHHRRPTSRRWPSCRPRRAARPGRRRVPGAAHQGRRSVPGVHAELRLRREGTHRPARRRARGAAPQPRPRPREAARPRPRRARARPRRRAPAPRTPGPEPTSDAEARTRDRDRNARSRRLHGNHDHRRPPRRLQEHDRARAERVPQGVRGGVRRHRCGTRSRWPRPPAAGGGGAAAAAEEQDEFDVILAAAGDKKIQVIKEVRDRSRASGLKEAKDLVDGAPKPVLEKVTKEDAEKAKAKLERPAPR